MNGAPELWVQQLITVIQLQCLSPSFSFVQIGISMWVGKVGM